jgi:predicted enzyme related to lactoylglutathione lyase
MTKPLAALHIYVTDLERSQAFYGDLLGVSFERRGDVIAAGELQNLGIILEKTADGRSGLTAAVSFEVDDIEATVDQLKQQGVRVNRDVTDTPQGKVANLTDMDGNPLEFVQRRS